MKLEVGTKVQSCNRTWTVARVCRVYYHLTADGSKSLKNHTFPILKSEAHRDIESGIAKVIA